MSLLSVVCPSCRSRVGAPCLRFDGSVLVGGHSLRRDLAAGFAPEDRPAPKTVVGFDLGDHAGRSTVRRRGATSPFPKARPRPIAGWDAPVPSSNKTGG